MPRRRQQRKAPHRPRRRATSPPFSGRNETGRRRIRRNGRRTSVPGVEPPTLAVLVHECGHHTVCVGVDVRPHEFCVHKCKCASMCVCVCVCVCACVDSQRVRKRQAARLMCPRTMFTTGAACAVRETADVSIASLTLVHELPRWCVGAVLVFKSGS